MLRYEQQDRDLCSSAMAIDTVNNDIYWSVNSNPVNSISDGYGYVMKNEEIVLDNVLGTCINDISLDGGDIYSAGYMNDIYDATAACGKTPICFIFTLSQETPTSTPVITTTKAFIMLVMTTKIKA